MDTNEQQSQPIGEYQAFFQLYQQLNADADIAQLLATTYHPDIDFSDPFHSIQGLTQLTQYFEHLYQDVEHIWFDFHPPLVGNQQEAAKQQWAVEWLMTYRHPKLHRGQQDIQVNGVSLLRWQEGKIISHRDFFDGGAMLYEHIPLLGWGVKKIKERLS